MKKEVISLACSALMVLSPTVFAAKSKAVKSTKTKTVKTAKNNTVKTNPVKAASINWRDKIIYSVLADQFSDGDTSNDVIGKGKGDFKGIINNSDYIKNLGATSVCIIPSVTQKWLNSSVQNLSLDKNLGNINLYKQMVKKFHDNKMSVIQDLAFSEPQNKKYKTAYDNLVKQTGIDTFNNGKGGALNTKLNSVLVDIFKNSKPTSEFTNEIEQSKYTNCNGLINFVDNPDTKRWIDGESNYDSLKQALTAIMTLPGIPMIYNGTEQNELESRGSMDNKFNSNSEMYKFIKKLCSIRSSNKVFTSGEVSVLKDNENTSGVLAYEMTLNDQNAVMVFNTSNNTQALNNIDTGIDDYVRLKLLYSDDDSQKDIVLGDSGKLSMEIKPGKFAIFTSDKVDQKDSPSASISCDNFVTNQIVEDDYELKGQYKNAKEIYALVDGNVDTQIKADLANGKWNAKFLVSGLKNGLHNLALKAVDQAGRITMTDSLLFKLNHEVEQTKSANGNVVDPENDDKGPSGNYTYPTDPTYSKQFDILGMKAEDMGDNLTVTVSMKNITDSWSPTNGFDHVTFTMFLQDPNKQGATVMPLQSSNVPDGFKWNYELFAGGWDNNLYSSDGATADAFGTQLSGKVSIVANKGNGTVTFNIPKSAIGNPKDLNGWKIYLSTFDFDGVSKAFRAISKVAGQYTFGGGKEDNSKEPKIMDDAILQLSSGSDNVNASGSENASTSGNENGNTSAGGNSGKVQAVIEDKEGDDKGPSGTYTYPTDKTYSKQFDVLGVKAEDIDDNLCVTVTMKQITDSWSPSNGFDHVTFTMFLQDPNKQGATVMPLQNSNVPDGFKWNYELFAGGWDNNLYSSDGATADAFGTQLDGKVLIVANKGNGTVTFNIPKSAIGNPKNLSGWKIYLSTFDFDGVSKAFRAISKVAAQYTFGGGKEDNSKEPKIMDDIVPITLK